MTDQNYTHLAFLLDASGSMQLIKSDVEGGFDAFIAEQRSQPGRCTVSLSDFSGYDYRGLNGSTELDYRQLYVGSDITEVKPLDLQPRASTALLDSIGRMIRETGEWLAAMPEDERPGLVIFGIMTDGLENASREMNHAAIKAMITEQETKYGWVFNYLGANQDAIEVGAKMGISAQRSMTYAPSRSGEALGATSSLVSVMRGMAAAGADHASVMAAAAYSTADREQAGK